MRAPSHHLVVSIVVLLGLAGAALRAPPRTEAPLRGTLPRPTPPAGLVDLNSAPFEALDALPGVGAVTARAIIAARPFRSVEELGRVRGIGPTRLRRLRPLVTAR